MGEGRRVKGEGRRAKGERGAGAINETLPLRPEGHLIAPLF